MPSEYRGFTKLYKVPVKKLTTPVNILPTASADKALRGVRAEVSALWDTGATITCIKPELRDRFKLRMAETGSSMPIAGIGGIIKAGFTIVSIFLAHNFKIEYCPVYVLDFPGNADMIIGMDIITMGDFVVCNAKGETSFSFAIPSFPDRIDLADKADAANRKNTV
ncbi:hypothetical protein AGMMS49942_17670 [Spirochaetia bacterium]|nr:hypothetical protein AGMMS49942_17670 [Spirochaetia bacterium]